MHIQTLEGWLHVSPGDWIIRGVKGEFYPCKPDVFDATYVAVDRLCDNCGCEIEDGKPHGWAGTGMCYLGADE